MRLIIMFIAIALAAGAFVLTMYLTNSEPKQTGPVIATPQTIVKEVPTTDIYTAKQDIPIGTVIKPEMLDIQPWPKHLKLPDMVEAVPNQPSEIVRMVARTPFQKGEPIIMNKLANEKDPSFLAAALPKGMRVVTIAIDSISGVGGFIFPGDRVDVLITHDISLGKSADDSVPSNALAENNAGNSVAGVGGASANNYQSATGGISAPSPVRKDPITEVLLANVRIMAVNQKSTAHGGDLPSSPNYVSLEVSASDAQKLRLSESGNGRLSLALRSLQDKDETELARPTGLGDLSRLTPPAYFPVLYDSSGRAMFANGNADNSAREDGLKTLITVVRGVKTEAVEVSRP